MDEYEEFRAIRFAARHGSGINFGLINFMWLGFVLALIVGSILAVFKGN